MEAPSNWVTLQMGLRCSERWCGPTLRQLAVEGPVEIFVPLPRRSLLALSDRDPRRRSPVACALELLTKRPSVGIKLFA